MVLAKCLKSVAFFFQLLNFFPFSTWLVCNGFNVWFELELYVLLYVLKTFFIVIGQEQENLLFILACSASKLMFPGCVVHVHEP